MLTEIQKERFLSIAGKEYDESSDKGEFTTEFPYNDKDWNLSPWLFRFWIDTNNGNLYCEISHRMTNNRMYGWDKNGIELPIDKVQERFPNTDGLIIKIKQNKKDKNDGVES